MHSSHRTKEGFSQQRLKLFGSLFPSCRATLAAVLCVHGGSHTSALLARCPQASKHTLSISLLCFSALQAPSLAHSQAVHFHQFKLGQPSQSQSVLLFSNKALNSSVAFKQLGVPILPSSVTLDSGWSWTVHTKISLIHIQFDLLQAEQMSLKKSKVLGPIGKLNSVKLCNISTLRVGKKLGYLFSHRKM